MEYTLYNLRKKQHLCIVCGKQDERTLVGKIRCKECSEKTKTYGQNSYQKRKERLKNEGLCIKCGEEKARTNLIMCEKCAEISKVRCKEYYCKRKLRGLYEGL